MDEPATVAEAYSLTGQAWQDGPGRIYRRLAEVLVARSPLPLAGRLVLDLGAGTGAATIAIRAAGGRPIAADVAPGMLAAIEPRPPALATDALAIALKTASVEAVVAAFSLNHLTDPVAGLREAARVTRPGGVVLASAYAEDDAHPAKQAVDDAATEVGWSPPAWYQSMRADAVPRLATTERMCTAAAAAGLEAEAEAVQVPFPELDGRDLVAWRLGMAQLAPFVARLSPEQQTQLVSGAQTRLGANHPPLVRSIVLLVARR